jgi:tripartite-type tricarboxylate transporter receptor subunit TctC
VREVLKMPDVVSRLSTVGSLPSPNAPAEFDAIIKRDEQVYSALLKKAGVQAK